jgi:hypothetical protein
MPLMKYFGFVGSALVLLLLVTNWLLPEPASEPVHGSIERPVIRIRSMETLPERVVFDTSMPSMAAPPTVTRVAVQPLQSAFRFEQLTPGVLPTFSTVAQVAPEKQPITVKRATAKMVATHRAPSRVHTAATKNYDAVREAELEARPPVKTTLLEDIAGRFGQIFKVN